MTSELSCDRAVGNAHGEPLGYAIQSDYDYEISIGRVASFEFHTFAIDGSYRFLEVEENAVLQVRTKSPICGTRKSLYRPFFWRHDRDLELTRAPRGSDLEADEACPMTTTRRSAQGHCG
jgi:hypothetical protein